MSNEEIARRLAVSPLTAAAAISAREPDGQGVTAGRQPAIRPAAP